jgi:hypothetical protein
MELESLDAARVGHAYPAFFHEVQQTGKAGQRIARAVRNDGQMVAIERTRNSPREEAAARQRAAWLMWDVEGAQSPGQRKSAQRALERWKADNAEWDDAEAVVGRLKHAILFRQETSVGGLKAAMPLARGAAAALAAGIEAHGNLGGIMRDVQTAVEGAKEAMDVLAALDGFTTPDNLLEVADWLNSYDDHDFRLYGRRLICGNIGKGFGLPVGGWSLPETPALTHMLEALRGSAALA